MMEGLENFGTISLLGVLLRWSIAHFPYSGAGKPPMYGDYEAQRHWQEITVNLPSDRWYINSTDNDLLYWGLDYPPLTAYHSYVCGFVANLLNQDFVSLHLSRGFESYHHKLFMRYSVLIMDLIIYFPSAYFICRRFAPKKSFSIFLALLLYPGLYLIDYGHFQYNSISLGLLLLAIGALLHGKDCLGAVAFSLALNYKQMELYHALPFFFFLLAKCFKEASLIDAFLKLLKIGGSVIATFVILWFPFLKSSEMILAVLRRIFPIARGLFEDKVASVWCSLSLLIKFKNIFDNSTMALICLISTAICVLPSNLHLLFKPTNFNFKCALVNNSLVFFLLSFHVHEKSILLATIPACLLFYEHRFVVTWFFFVSLISMIPLLVKDGLLIPVLSLSALTLLSLQLPISANESLLPVFDYRVYKKIFAASVSFLSIVVILGLIFSPPARYPDLFPVILSSVCCLHFCLFTLYFHYCQFALKNSDKMNKKKA